MTVKVKYEERPVNCRFIKLGNELRMYMRSNDYWCPSIGWCPHLDISGGECRDCSLVLDEDE